MKLVSQADVIRFVKREIIHRFGLPETLTCDNGSVFSRGEVSLFAQEYGMTITFSTPYYAQGNGQAEASNKVIKDLKEDDNRNYPLCANFQSRRHLAYELAVKSLRVARQYEMTPSEYADSMMAELVDLDEERLLALDRVQAQKVKVAKAYNKKVRPKAFVESDLVLKAVLPIGRMHSKPSVEKFSLLRIQDIDGLIEGLTISIKWGSQGVKITLDQGESAQKISLEERKFGS
ncbi:uncharacterized protein LOC122644859 [Telopea speciosissima]|uniref:uncharacterized protein LOC122644859 n=1 Tax=Telopea speciosissima TaxID=54955 RepID=UPI001CC42DE7|nr:uncharacterized protein LOC122644859 [Telopea speciosissima]